MAQLVVTEIEAGVASITLNRPERLNAINPEMGEAFDRAMLAAQRDEAVRVVVITGAGKGFCAGGDMDRLRALMADGGVSLPPGPVDGGNGALDGFIEAPLELRSRYTMPFALEKPVIAAVNGAAAGVGFALAVACDIRFASRRAVFTAGFPRRGLTAEAGLAWSLTTLAGRGVASDLLLSGRRVEAEEALRLGLVNAVLEPGDLAPHALAYARDIAANCSPRSTRVIKRQLGLALDQTFAEALALSRREVEQSMKAEDFREGVESFLEGRAARFTGR
jgi:enoyl-CoA hydratase/carnithine racemase